MPKPNLGGTELQNPFKQRNTFKESNGKSIKPLPCILVLNEIS